VISVFSVVIFFYPSPEDHFERPFNSVIYFFLDIAIIILDY